jgi:hypothetical protein
MLHAKLTEALVHLSRLAQFHPNRLENQLQSNSSIVRLLKLEDDHLQDSILHQRELAKAVF